MDGFVTCRLGWGEEKVWRCRVTPGVSLRPSAEILRYPPWWVIMYAMQRVEVTARKGLVVWAGGGM